MLNAYKSYHVKCLKSVYTCETRLSCEGFNIPSSRLEGVPPIFVPDTASAAQNATDVFFKTVSLCL